MNWVVGVSAWAAYAAGPDFLGCVCAPSASEEVRDVGAFPVFALHPSVFSLLIAKVQWLPG